MSSPLPVLAIAHGTTGIVPSCAPSLAPTPLDGGAMAATDLFDLANNVKDSAAGKIVSAYIAGSWELVYPELGIPNLIERDYLHSVREVSQNCFSGLDSLASVVRTSQMAGPIFVEQAFDPVGPLATRFQENSVSVETVGLITVPVLIAQGEADSLVLPSMQNRWVESMCAAGQELEYRTYPGLDHMPLVAAGSALTPQVVQWSMDRLAGGPVTSTCTP